MAYQTGEEPFFWIFTSLLSTPVFAGPFTDEMTKCLVKSTSASDKTLLIKWVFAAMSSHPDLKDLSKVSKERGDELNKDVSGLFMSMLIERCSPEADQALKYEGSKALEASFQMLGQVAMQGIMSNQNVTNYMDGLGKYMDTTDQNNASGR